MGKRAQTVKTSHSQGHRSKSGGHSSACRRPAGRKAGPAPDPTGFGKALKRVVVTCFPDLNRWLGELPDPRKQSMCKYAGSHIWWQILLTFILRNGSRNAFDADRNTGQMPENVLRLCGQQWDEKRLGKRRTVTCSGNAVIHAGRVSHVKVGMLLLAMVKRLIQMRLLESARLFNRWWLIVIDGTLQDRGRKTTRMWKSRYRYIVEAKLIGPFGTIWPLMTEFQDMSDPIREKEDCELNACLRLMQRLEKEFPRLPICFLFDGLYPVQRIFDRVVKAGWKFIATLKEGRQPNAYDEAVQTMLLSPSNVYHCQRMGEDGIVDQTLRWTQQVPFDKHEFDVVFAGEISPTCATLWAWVTNLSINTGKEAFAVANHGGRVRNRIESSFNVQKNDGFGLEHAFCANETASKNYHLIMQMAHTINQLLIGGLLRRLTRGCRKVTDIALIVLLRNCLQVLTIGDDPIPRCQIRLAPI